MTQTFQSDYQPTMKKWAPVLMFFLLLTGIGFMLEIFILQSVAEQIASLLLGAVLILLFLYLLLVIPLSLTLDEEGVVIQRRWRQKRIPYSIIKDVFVYDEVQGDIRYFGSNGFLGYIGIMGSTKHGKYSAYVKNPRQQVFLSTQTKNYLFSCEDSALFVKVVKQKITATQ